MADLADIAGEHDFNDEILTRHKNRKKNVQATGVCLSCEAKIEANAIYCDADCREDHERRLKAQKIHKNANYS